jgi:hypothetical protein
MASPASAAAPPCGSYPPGNAYGLHASGPQSAQPGRTVALKAILSHNGERCAQRKVLIAVHGPQDFRTNSQGQRVPTYHIWSGNDGVHGPYGRTTDANGVATFNVTMPGQDFRWYAIYNSDNGTGQANTPVGANETLVQTTSHCVASGRC